MTPHGGARVKIAISANRSATLSGLVPIYYSISNGKKIDKNIFQAKNKKKYPNFIFSYKTIFYFNHIIIKTIKRVRVTRSTPVHSPNTRHLANASLCQNKRNLAKEVSLGQKVLLRQKSVTWPNKLSHPKKGVNSLFSEFGFSEDDFPENTIRRNRNKNTKANSIFITNYLSYDEF